MHSELQNLYDQISASKKLTDQEKFGLLDEVKKAEKHLATTEFKLLRTEKIKRTTAVLLEETIAELEQKRKVVVEQAREAEIEVALERVRARTMAMQNSRELADTVNLLFQQMEDLGVKPWRCGIAIVNDDLSITTWTVTPTAEKRDIDFTGKTLDVKGHPFGRNILKAWKEQSDLLVYDLKGKDVGAFYNFLMRRSTDGSRKKTYKEWPERIVYYHAIFKQGSVFSAFPESISEKDSDLLSRFANVFEQTYTRFLDLQKAEAQTRELEIDASLEKIRAHTNGMQESTQLADVIKVVFDETLRLGFGAEACDLVILDGKRGTSEFWISGSIDKEDVVVYFKTPKLHNKHYLQALEAWEEQRDLRSAHLKGRVCSSYLGKLSDAMERCGVPLEIPGFLRNVKEIHHTEAYMRYGYFRVASLAPLKNEEQVILTRFAKSFEQTYTRFLDLQKAEAQAREAQIEASLERVRARSLAMHNSSELQEIVGVVHEQLKSLNLQMDGTQIEIYADDPDHVHIWVANEQQPYGKKIMLPHLNHPMLVNFIKARNEGAQSYSGTFSKAEKNRYYRKAFRSTELKEIPEARKQLMLDGQGLSIYASFVEKTALHVLNFQGREYGKEDQEIVGRFSKVVEQAYTRFLDLKRAEEQAREAQIETSIERIRSAANAMKDSRELANVIRVIFEETERLDFGAKACDLVILDSETGGSEFWISGVLDQGNEALHFKLPKLTSKHYREALKSWKNGERLRHTHLTGNACKGYLRQMVDHMTESNVPKEVKNFLKSIPAVHHTEAYMQYGFFRVAGVNELNEEDRNIILRFTKVFEQSYTRFLDLQRAEAQAREAQIEASLERVRAASLAMHDSSQIADVSNVLFRELRQYGGELFGCGFVLCDRKSPFTEHWISVEEGELSKALVHKDLDSIHLSMYKAWKNKKDLEIIEIKGKRLRRHYQVMHQSSDLRKNIESISETAPSNIQINHVVPFKQGYLLIVTNDRRFNDTEILPRFAKVFEQTYTRFLDLQKAEAQAKEAKIEAALERVRAKAMAMHSSSDLSDTINVIFKEVKQLGIKTLRLGLGIIDRKTRICDITATTVENGKEDRVTGKVKLSGHPFLDGLFDHWCQAKDYFGVLRGQELTSYYQYLKPQIKIPVYPDSTVHYGYHFVNPEGGVYAWTDKELDEEIIQIFQRFSKVLELTYRRYRDLIASEEREKEALKQSSLDRVRAEIASMRKTKDLERITPLVFKELTNLGVPFFRCGVFIIDEEKEEIDVYLATPNGTSLAAWNSGYQSNDFFKDTVSHWKKGEEFHDRWTQKQFISFTKTLIDQGLIESPKGYQGGVKPPENLYLQMVPFNHGMLYVGSAESLTKDELELVKDLARAFSEAYSRYEDFKQLEIAKGKVEGTLSELRSAQEQLVHSEKMASLGELTAGIAHEIQNPLNFVNNFSDVNKELAEELLEAVQIGNRQEAEAIIADMLANEEKIHHHGQRADAIVKGMLQHSRGSSGEKELTDINALCDEYLRLAYHGLRAKDKSFNAEFKLELDESLPKVNVVPQDIGRVLLNLINNAFYASSAEALAKAGSGYKPLVTVSTKNLGYKVEVSVKDNGTGIPANIRDKIFQPFFTTKETGKGTGLGLSLSFDIITKGHGGEMEVKSTKGKGSEFIVTIPIE